MTSPIDPLRNSQDAATTPIGVTTLCPQCGAAMPAFETRCSGCGHHRAPGTEEEQREQLRRRLQNGIGDAYELVDMLGKGGMGVVFRAKEKSLEREVALKVLAFDPLMAPEAFARFEREAKLAARLDHPHIVPIFAVGQGQGLAFYTMRIVRGGSLEDLLAREKKLEPTRAVRYLREIATALDHAHTHGVVHRDIKPANIMLGDGDHILVADFGIARAVGGDAGALTSTGVVGSPAYMAPEQWQGQGIDGRADQYALGILAYELLTGKRPYRDASMHELLRLHLTEELPDITADLPNVSPVARDVLRRATAKDPVDRFANTSEFVGALARALDGTAASAATMAQTAQTLVGAAGAMRTATTVPRAAAATAATTTAPPQRSRLWLVAVLVLAVAGGGYALVQSLGGDKGPIPPAPIATVRPETVIMKQAAPPETVRINQATPPPAGRSAASVAAAGVAPAAVTGVAPGYVIIGHPMVPNGQYFIDGVAIEPKRPPIYQISAGRPHAIGFKAGVPTFPAQTIVRVEPGDTARIMFLPTEGGGARGDSMRARLRETLRRTQGRGGRGFPQRGVRGDTL